MKRCDLTRRQVLQMGSAALANQYLELSASAERRNEMHGITIHKLRCEYLHNPLGVDVDKPHLSWALESKRRGEKQNHFQIVVASSQELLKKDVGDLWDSGKFKSHHSSQIEYGGKPLKSRTCCYWKVRIWNRNGDASAWSSPALWTMGLLNPEEWKAKWIGIAELPAPLDMQTLTGAIWIWDSHEHQRPTDRYDFRTHFEVPKGRVIRTAQAIIAAQSSFHMTLNGHEGSKGTSSELPAFVDLTRYIIYGTNNVSIQAVSNGSTTPSLICKIIVFFEGEPPLVVFTGDTWESSMADQEASPVMNSWKQVRLLDAYGGGPLKAFAGPVKWGGDPAWVPTPRYLRRQFFLKNDIHRATLHVTALGLYELHLNGERCGNGLLTPDWTDYSKRVQLQSYDLTCKLHRGENVMGAIVANGFYCGYEQNWPPRPRIWGDEPYLLMQLEVEYTNGSRDTITSDEYWKATVEGPIRFAGIYEGEAHDARRAMPGWDASSFDDSGWKTVKIRPEYKAVPLVWQRTEPIVIRELIKPIKVTEPKPGVYVFDVGQNISGWCRLKTKGERGNIVTLKHNEVINPDGTVYMEDLWAGCTLIGERQTDHFVLAGNGIETFEPHFTQHGFRYVEVSGLLDPPNPETIVVCAFGTNAAITGSFTCSDLLLTRLAENILSTARQNMRGIPASCSARDEREAYSGDTQVFMPTLLYNMDVAALMRKWLVDLCEDAQCATGAICDMAPNPLRERFTESDYKPWAGWSDAGIICPYLAWKEYGDLRFITDHYESMRRNLAWQTETANADGIRDVEWVGGDWLNLGGNATPAVIATAYYAYDAGLMAEMAEAIGQNRDSSEFNNLAQKLHSVFAENFIQSDGSIKGCSQSGYALAFGMDLIPDEMKEKAAKQFILQMERFDWHLSTGFLGTARLLRALHRIGRDDVAYRVLLQRTYPGWLYQVEAGATTTWEHWDSWREGHGFAGRCMNSFGHIAFGSCGDYLFGVIGGINADSIAYKTIRIEPVIEQGITWAKANYESIQGNIMSSWEYDGGNVLMNIEIPVGTTATVFVPTTDHTSITESDIPAGRAPNVTFLRIAGEAAVYNVGSGKYRFHSEWSQRANKAMI